MVRSEACGRNLPDLKAIVLYGVDGVGATQGTAERDAESVDQVAKVGE